MWFATLLKRLWDARTGVAVALGVAALAAMLVAFRVVIAVPPSIEGRRYTVGVAGISLQLDTTSSQIVDGGGETGNNIRTLSDRASLLGALLATPPVKHSVARSLNIAPERVVVTTAMSFQERTRALQREVSDSTPSRDSVVIDVKDPRLDEGFSPIIQVQTEAPDTALAIAAAEESLRALREYVQATAERDGVPPARRLVFRQLEPVRYGEERRGPGRLVAPIVALAVLGGGCAVVLYVGGIAGQMRRRRQTPMGRPRAAGP